MLNHKCLTFTLLSMALVLINPANAQKESLLIGPGDLLRVQVFDTPELEQHARVSDRGDLPLLMVGNVHVAGETPAQAALSVEDALQKGQFLNHPRVAITVEQYATQNVSVLGEVKLPSAYPIGTSRSVLDVLTLAGGLTEFADRNILIERRSTKEKVPYFVSNKAEVALDSAVQVYPGDTVIVPRAGIVYVLGDVQRPGGYTMTNYEGQLTVLQLMARAGGINQTAKPAHAKLIQKRGNGYIEETLPLDEIERGKRVDMALHPDDIIWIPFSYLRASAMNASSIIATAGAAAVYKF